MKTSIALLAFLFSIPFASALKAEVGLDIQAWGDLNYESTYDF